MNNYNEEREINLVDMFWSICLKWRSILLWGLIFALILGGFSFYKSSKTIDLDTIEFEEEEEEAIDAYLAYESLYETQADYNEYSPLMQLDANRFYTNVITYYVDNHYQVEYPIVEGSNNINALVQAYKASLKTDTFRESIATAVELDRKAIPYATELVDLNNVYGDTTSTSGADNIITITIYGSTQAECESLSTLVKETIASQADAMTAQFDEHDVTIVSEGIKATTDIDLSSYQKRNIDTYTSYKTSLETQKEGLSDTALEYVNAVTKSHKEDSEETENTEDAGVSITTIIKFAIIGLILGAFVAVFFVAMAYILSTKLRVADGFERMFGVKILGYIPDEAPTKKKIFGFIDRMFTSKLNRNKPKLTKDEAIDMIITDIKLLAKQYDIKEVYATGTTIASISEDVQDYISKKLSNNDVNIYFGESILTSATALEDASAKGNVVIIEKAGEAKYNDIYGELDMSSKHKIRVLGAVIVE